MNKRMTAILAESINKKIRPINKLFPDINHGGCGVFACRFAEKMISLGFDAKIIELHLYNGWSSPMLKDRFTENNRNMHIAAAKHKSPDECNVSADSHYCVKIGAYYFDSCVFRKKSGDKLKMYSNFTYSIVGEVCLPDLEYVSIESRGEGIWNDMYDSSDNEGIKSFIDEQLSLLITHKKVKK
jgi:hypothetical protein